MQFNTTSYHLGTAEEGSPAAAPLPSEALSVEGSTSSGICQCRHWHKIVIWWTDSDSDSDDTEGAIWTTSMKTLAWTRSESSPSMPTSLRKNKGLWCTRTHFPLWRPHYLWLRNICQWRETSPQNDGAAMAVVQVTSDAAFARWKGKSAFWTYGRRIWPHCHHEGVSRNKSLSSTTIRTLPRTSVCKVQAIVCYY